MKTKMQKLNTLQYAAKLIQNNADDLRLAFMKCDGSFGSADSDIEREISDMEHTVTQLYLLSEDYSASSGIIQ